MKKIIAITLITLGLLLTSINIVRSFFYQTVFFTGIKFKVGDFVSPPKVILSQRNIVTLNENVHLSWSKVEDYKNYSDPVYYRLSFLGREYKVNQNKYDLSISDLIPGKYIYRVKACDQLNNCSSWSEEGKVIIPDKILEGDSHKNGDLFQISNSNSVNQWDSNYLKLNIDNNYEVQQLNFSYTTDSLETLSGFDQTKLFVTVNDQIIFLESEVKDMWQSSKIDLSPYSVSPLEIKFYSGNQGDDKFSSWVEIKDIQFFTRLEEGTIAVDSNILSDQAKSLGIIY